MTSSGLPPRRLRRIPACGFSPARLRAAVSAIMIVSVAGLCPAAASPQTLRTGTLTVDVSGFKRTGGTVHVEIFDSPSAWMKRPVFEKLFAVEGEHAVWKIPDVPHGDYAIAVFHDENSNGKTDTNLFGRPKEPYGFSNDGRCISGPPSWSTARVPFHEHQSTVLVRVR